jgi:hypothetical protein
MSRSNQGIVWNELHDEVRQAEAQFIARQQTRLFDGLTIYVSAVSRSEIMHHQFVAIERQSAMTTADPAVVDPQRDVRSPTDFGRKLVENNFTRTGQGILADKAKFHGWWGLQTAAVEPTWRAAIQ